MSFVSSIPSMMTGRTILCHEYNFDASAKTVEVPDDVIGFVMVVNATDGVVIFNPANIATGGKWVGRTLFLTYDSTSMSDTDDLLVFCERKDPAEPLQPILQRIEQQLLLLNARFEDAYATDIDEEDI